MHCVCVVGSWLDIAVQHNDKASPIGRDEDTRVMADIRRLTCLVHEEVARQKPRYELLVVSAALQDFSLGAGASYAIACDEREQTGDFGGWETIASDFFRIHDEWF